MSFFQDHRKQISQKNKNVTLQVRIIPPVVKLDPKKTRALPFVSLNLSASLTVEAAFALPLFIFMAVCLMAPMRMMDQQRRVQAALESVCSDASRYAYMKYQMDAGIGDLPAQGEWGREFSKYFLNGGLLVWAAGAVKARTDSGVVENISLLDSRILEDGETLDLIASYKIKLPFPIFRIDGIPMVSRSRRRAWIGREGLGGPGASEGEREEEIVFVGKKSTRYHRRRTCHYLYNNISAVQFDGIGAYRNESGGRYHPCSRCGKRAKAGGTVYIMPEGGSYHSDKSCSAIVAYVRAVPLSEAAHLGPCSYCSR